MKTNMIMAGLAGLLLLISGCLPSLHPLYTDEDVVFDESLLGTWEKSDETWTFSSEDAVSYELKVISQEDTSFLKAHMLVLSDQYFMDLYPMENDHVGIPDHLAMNLLPVHTFVKVNYNEQEMQIRFFDPSWFSTLIEENKALISYEVLDDGDVVLTAPTEELQTFVSIHAHETSAFTDADKFTKLH